MRSVNIDLSYVELFEGDLYVVAKKFNDNPNETSKKIFDREINNFVSKTTGAVKRLDKEHSKGSNITYVMGGNRSNHVVSFFDMELFSDVKKLHKEIESKLKNELGSITFDNETLRFNIIGKSINLRKEKDGFKNDVIVVAEFVSSLKINSYCIVKK